MPERSHPVLQDHLALEKLTRLICRPVRDFLFTLSVRNRDSVRWALFEIPALHRHKQCISQRFANNLARPGTKFLSPQSIVDLLNVMSGQCRQTHGTDRCDDAAHGPLVLRIRRWCQIQLRWQPLLAKKITERTLRLRWRALNQQLGDSFLRFAFRPERAAGHLPANSRREVALQLDRHLVAPLAVATRSFPDVPSDASHAPKCIFKRAFGGQLSFEDPKGQSGRPIFGPELRVHRRAGGTRTHDLLSPRQARYQAAPQPVALATLHGLMRRRRKHRRPYSAAAIRSPITTQGMLVLARGIWGISEASATTTWRSPCTRPCSSHTASSSDPIRHVPTGW